MSLRLRVSLSVLGLMALPLSSRADDLGVPDLAAGRMPPHAAYRDAVFPPPQHNMFGQPVPPAPPRPAYRQVYNDFPRGQYGGGFIEAVVDGLQPAPRAPVVAPSSPRNAVAVYGAPRTAGLPQADLPDYAPNSATFFGPAAPAAAPEPVPQPATYGGPVYAVPDAASGAAGADPARVPHGMNPMFERQVVDYDGRERPGTIVIDTPHKFLYLVQQGGRAIRYGIGVGRPGFTWAGVKTVTRKAEWPGWTPPAEMLKRRPELPRHMEGGIGNPLGARALYLGSSLYRIHGTNEPYTIGTNVSSGCIRMMNQDVIDLYGRVGVGTKVRVL